MTGSPKASDEPVGSDEPEGSDQPEGLDEQMVPDADVSTLSWVTLFFGSGNKWPVPTLHLFERRNPMFG